MADHPDRLYQLLPVIDRQRDAERGWPLRTLLRVIAKQVDLVEADIAQLYENWFIETCENWVVPYIGDLIGYRPVHDAGEAGDVITAEGRQRNQILTPRREVANTIAFRRRKGTLALLEALGLEVAGWPAVRAVEFRSLLDRLQSMSAPQPQRGLTVDLRQGAALDRLGGPFDLLSHTVDVRGANSHRTVGRFNITNLGLFVWRLHAYGVTHSSAYCLEDTNPHCFTFSILSNDTPLFTQPEPVAGTEQLQERHLPVPIHRRTFKHHKADYYGAGKSILIWAPHWPKHDAPQPVSLDAIIPADLSNWHYRPHRDTVAVDSELGRIAFPPGQQPAEGVWVTYSYGLACDLGGGEYQRPIAQHPDAVVTTVREGTRLGVALAEWQTANPLHAVIEIQDSAVYTEQLPQIMLRPGQTLQLRASNGRRPVLRLLDYQAGTLDAIHLCCAAGSCFILDGIMVTGRGLEIEGPRDNNGEPILQAEGDPARVVVRHATLVPGWSLHSSCEPQRAEEASLWLSNVRARLRVEHSIIGSIQIEQDEQQMDPIPITISDSVLDATLPDDDALGGADWPRAAAILTIRRSTVFGLLQVREIELAENTIFNNTVTVSRHQRGCMRFCYVPLGSRTPRRYNCQPDLVQQAAEAELRAAAVDAQAEVPAPEEVAAARQLAADRVVPHFNSIRYSTPAYCQLAQECAGEIKRGADDEGELGVFHDLFEPQREANLRARLDEYTPAGSQVGIFFAN